MPGQLLDSNVIISHLRTPLPLAAFMLQWAAEDGLAVSVITRTEVLAGMHERQAMRTLPLLETLAALPVTDAIADRAGRWIYHYARRGVQLTLADVLIAATAVEHGLVLVTGNAKHFPMAELQVKVWDGTPGGG